MNNVIVSGRLTRDAEIRYLENNNAVARFTLAVDKNLNREKKQELEAKGQATADFINCQAWGKMAESLAKYSGKGLRVLVSGRIQTGSYEKDGQRVYTTDVVANNIEFIDWKGNSNNQGQGFDDFSGDFDPDDDYGARIPF